MPERLPNEIANLADQVQLLNSELSNYASRTDLAKVKQDSKRELRNRWIQVAVFFVVVVLVTNALQNTTISQCFLDPNQNPRVRRVCELSFGDDYVKTRTQGSQNLEMFRKLIQQVQTNTKRIDELERRR